jgi:uncharacterized membrane protein YqjE
MEEPAASLSQLTTPSKAVARRLLTIGENRLELLNVEVQEERERVLHALLLTLGVVAFGTLAGLTLAGALVIWLWAYSPGVVLLVLTALYGGAGFWMRRRLAGFVREWQTFPASLEQLRKDRECVENLLK